MKETFSLKLGLSKLNEERLNIINDIVEEYLADNYVLTLRQLYYQLVSRDVIPNNQKEYAKLSDLLKKGRMAGIVDWQAIEDRGRQPKIPYYVTGIQGALQDTVDQYRLDRMAGQPKYIEVWVEKDALSNVLLRVTEEYHVRLMVNKGYSSCSAMYEASKRFIRMGQKRGREAVLLYFGDHDPSGKDMVRDIRDRMTEFGVELSVINPALTMQQIRRYRPPENPAKISDPRAAWYIKEYGNKSWELDALPPKVLVEIIRKSVLDHIDEDLYKAQLDKEEDQKITITKIMDDYNDDTEEDDQD
jgi:hypothetical protein